MLARGGDLVGRRELLEELDVRDERGPGKESLEEIMAQERVLGRPARQGRLERIHVVDALSDVRAFAEQILINIGDRVRVRIHAGRSRENALEPGALTLAGEGGRHSRLQDAVPLDHAPHPMVERRPVERMRQRPDELMDRGSRQPGVRVQRDDVPDAGRHRRRGRWRRPAGREKGCVDRTPEQAVQLMQLAPLALPPHPLALARVPDSPSMEQEEPLAVIAR